MAPHLLCLHSLVLLLLLLTLGHKSVLLSLLCIGFGFSPANSLGICRLLPFELSLPDFLLLLDALILLMCNLDVLERLETGEARFKDSRPTTHALAFAANLPRSSGGRSTVAKEHEVLISSKLRLICC